MADIQASGFTADTIPPVLPVAADANRPAGKAAQAGVRAIVQTIGARILIQGLNAGTGIVTARTLMPEGRGQLAAMTMWSLFLAGLTTFGIPSSLVYFLRSRPEQRSTLIRTGVLMGAVLGTVAAAISVFFMPHWLHQYPAWLIRDAQILLIVTPICSLTYVGKAILEAEGQFTSSNLSQIISPLTTLIVLVLLLLTHHMSVLTAAIAYIVAIVPASAVMVIRIWPYYNRKAAVTVNTGKLLLSYGIRSYGIDLLGALSGTVDQILVVSLLTPTAMGLYVVMLSLSRIAGVFQSAVTQVLFPKASGQSTERILDLTGRATRVSCMITAAATLSLSVIGPYLLKWFYGKDYTSAIGCLRLLLLEATLSGMVYVLAQAYMALNHPGTVSVLQAVGLATSVPLMLVMIPRFGITGAALALLCSTAARLLFVLSGFRVYLKVPMPDLVPKRQDFLALFGRSRRAGTA